MPIFNFWVPIGNRGQVTKFTHPSGLRSLSASSPDSATSTRRFSPRLVYRLRLSIPDRSTPKIQSFKLSV